MSSKQRAKVKTERIKQQAITDEVLKEITVLKNRIALSKNLKFNANTFNVPMCRGTDKRYFIFVDHNDCQPILSLTEQQWELLLSYRASINKLINDKQGVLILNEGLFVRGFSKANNPYAKTTHFEVWRVGDKADTGVHFTLKDKTFASILNHTDNILQLLKVYKNDKHLALLQDATDRLEVLTNE